MGLGAPGPRGAAFISSCPGRSSSAGRPNAEEEIVSAACHRTPRHAAAAHRPDPVCRTRRSRALAQADTAHLLISCAHRHVIGDEGQGPMAARTACASPTFFLSFSSEHPMRCRKACRPPPSQIAAAVALSSADTPQALHIASLGRRSSFTLSSRRAGKTSASRSADAGMVGRNHVGHVLGSAGTSESRSVLLRR